MKIVFNISGLKDGDFLMELVNRFIISHPAHSILLVADKEIKGLPINSTNAKLQIIGPTIKNNISLKFWYDVKLPAAAKKFKADVVVNMGSVASLSVKLPQVLVLNNLDFINPFKNRLFYKLYQQKFIAKAKSIVVVNEWMKQEMTNQFKVAEDKVPIVHPAAHEDFTPINFEQRESTKDGFADGREYFLLVNDEQQPERMMNVLKAFSLFKKWQKSSMKLLVTGMVDDETKAKLKTYRHKEDVELLGSPTQGTFSKIMSASYALLDISSRSGLNNHLLQAFQSAVPVIAGMAIELPEIPTGTVLNTDPSNVEDIANQMKLLYRDENLRSQLIEKAQELAAHFSWGKSLSSFLQTIEAAAK